jgi:hypothetical protein
MQLNKIGSNSSSKSGEKSGGNGREMVKSQSQKRRLPPVNLFDCGQSSGLPAKLDGWPWWPGKSRIFIKIVFFF